MRQRLFVLGSLFIFWMSFGSVIRAVFLLYNHDLSEQLNASDVSRLMLHGMKMDISMTGYFLMAAGLLLTISMFVEKRWPYAVLYGLSVLLLVLSTLVMAVDLELYRHWGFRLTTAPFIYLKNTGSAAMGSVEVAVVIKLVLLTGAVITLFLFAFDRLLMPRIGQLSYGKKKGALGLLLVTAAMIIPIRGSFTVAPMNTGFVYFHKSKAYANHAAINVCWNFLYHLGKNTTIRYPENLIPAAVAQADFRTFYPPATPAPKLWDHPQPNVILFILESFTAGVVGPLGGLPDVTPHLNKLCSEGVLFTNFFATGDRTDKGIIGILSGYPAQPQTSIIKNPAKTQRLPYLNHYFIDLGYHTSFTYGGDVDFANFRSYLTNSRFDHITSDEDFPDELNQSKWGVHDHIVFQRALTETDTTRQPFFKVILSLSSHEPFDVPMVPYLPGNDQESLFLNSCRYTDASLGEFVTKAKASPWWENTIIIFVADHGHRFPGQKELSDKERFRVPLLMIGGPIKAHRVIDTFGGQTDLAGTLLPQFGKEPSAFAFSKNLLSPAATSFAMYFFNDGFGYVAPGQYVSYDNIGKRFMRREGAGEDDLRRAQSYQQILYSDYNNK